MILIMFQPREIHHFSQWCVSFGCPMLNVPGKRRTIRQREEGIWLTWLNETRIKLLHNSSTMKIPTRVIGNGGCSNSNDNNNSHDPTQLIKRVFSLFFNWKNPRSRYYTLRVYRKGDRWCVGLWFNFINNPNWTLTYYLRWLSVCRWR